MQNKDERPRPIPDFPDTHSHQGPLKSLNFISMHPDVIQPRTLACSCGRTLSLGEDWYTEIYDGTLVCWQCCSCSRCGLEGSVSNRRLVSIGGYVLCCSCIKFYGEPKKDAVRASVISKLKSAKETARRAKKATRESSNLYAALMHAQNCANSYNANWWKNERSPEGRRLIRYRDYLKPTNYFPSMDPKLQPLSYYTATQPMFKRMACPSCKTPARGKGAYVVPSISMVYHRSCFRCVACKTLMSTGIRRVGLDFVFCTCTPPLQWCTQPSCAQHRVEHHLASKCPGGRFQHDTQLLLAAKSEEEENVAASSELKSGAEIITGGERQQQQQHLGGRH